MIDELVVPEHFQDQMNELIKLDIYIDGQIPADTSAFSEALQHDFHNAALIRTFEFSKLSTEEINKLEGSKLKEDFLDLQSRIIDATKPKSMLGKLSSFLSGFVYTPVNTEQLEGEFNDLKNNMESELKRYLTREQTLKQSSLFQEIDVEEQLLKEKIEFLDTQITAEQKKSSVYSKRFKDITELYKFEAELKAAKPNVPKLKVVEMEPEIDDQVEEEVEPDPSPWNLHL